MRCCGVRYIQELHALPHFICSCNVDAKYNTYCLCNYNYNYIIYISLFDWIDCLALRFWYQFGTLWFISAQWWFMVRRKVWDTLDRYIFSCMEPAALDLRRYDLKWETDCRQFAQLTRLNTSMKCFNEMLKLLSWKCFGDRKMLFALVTTCDDHTNACKILWGWREISD